MARRAGLSSGILLQRSFTANGNEVGAECQTQPEQRCGGEKFQPADQSIGGHDWTGASIASIPRGDSLVTTSPVTATVAQTETSRTRRMTHHWAAIMGR